MINRYHARLHSATCDEYRKPLVRMYPETWPRYFGGFASWLMADAMQNQRS